MIAEYIDSIFELGASFGVNPLLFAIIYLAGIPIFFLVFAWYAKRLKDKKSTIWQLLLLGYLLIQPYLYVIIFGRGVPWWVYGVIVVLVAVGAWSLYKKVQGAQDSL